MLEELRKDAETKDVVLLPWVRLVYPAYHTVTIGRLSGDRVRLLVVIGQDMIAHVTVSGKAASIAFQFSTLNLHSSERFTIPVSFIMFILFSSMFQPD